MEEDVGRVTDEVLVGVEPELVRRGSDAAMPLAPTYDHLLQSVVEACNRMRPHLDPTQQSSAKNSRIAVPRVTLHF